MDKEWKLFEVFKKWANYLTLNIDNWKGKNLKFLQVTIPWRFQLIYSFPKNYYENVFQTTLKILFFPI